MDDSKYFNSVIPVPWTILGIRLLPLSIGHLTILHSLHSPFVTDEKAVTIGDLVLAVVICSRTYEEGIKALDSDDLGKQVEKWGKQLRGRGRWFGWFRKPIEINWPEKLKMFSDYMSDHLKAPDYSYDPSKSREVKCPIYQMIRVTLLHEMNLTESEVLNRPYAQAMWDYITLKTIQGQVNLIDAEANAEAQRKINAFMERLNNGKFKPDGQIRN